MFQTLLADIAHALDAAGIPYMVIGGQAVLLHGEPRLTRDIDITLGTDFGALEKLAGLAERLGLTPAVPDVRDFVRTTNVLPLSDPKTGIRVDLIFSFTPYERQAIGRAVPVLIDGVPVRYAAPDDLIIHKLVAGRPRDLEDVRGILARRPTLDEEHLRTWLESFRDIVHRDLVTEFHTLRKESLM